MISHLKPMILVANIFILCGTEYTTSTIEAIKRILTIFLYIHPLVLVSNFCFVVLFGVYHLQELHNQWPIDQALYKKVWKHNSLLFLYISSVLLSLHRKSEMQHNLDELLLILASCLVKCSKVETACHII